MTLETPRQRSVSESSDYADVMGPDTLAGEPDCATGSAQNIQSTPGSLAAVILLRDPVQSLMLSTLVLRLEWDSALILEGKKQPMNETDARTFRYESKRS
ncbi:hypothetical protein llap_5156 [Limosa lapponica baueri]|uniref:Uncharacterized protein n=1 Tax=Limosa lapponica baueri TaxID=1758121 RepID=A0A2I0UEU3_LIMLA|nr:hypothetical protein llap_5156 [Limosa lapponica baueri]